MRIIRPLLLLSALCLWGGAIAAQESAKIDTEWGEDQKVRFLVFTDLHHDLMPGGEERLRTILAAAERERADLILELGDFVFPKPENRIVPELLASASVPVWHVLGNHDMDVCDKQTYMDFVGIPAPYYSVRQGDYCFLVLDSNFFADAEGEEHEYDKGNFYGQPVTDRISSEQVRWLEQMLSDPDRIYVILSHAPINDKYDRAEKHADVHRVLVQARERGIRIAAAIAGHIHSDNFHVIDGINYWQVNSASYLWGGEEFDSKAHYPDPMYDRYPQLRYIVPYEEALYAIVEIGGDGTVEIRGVPGRFMEPAPDPEKLARKAYPCSGAIADRSFRF